MLEQLLLLPVIEINHFVKQKCSSRSSRESRTYQFAPVRQKRVAGGTRK